jgi:hypothetical protein
VAVIPQKSRYLHPCHPGSGGLRCGKRPYSRVSWRVGSLSARGPGAGGTPPGTGSVAAGPRTPSLIAHCCRHAATLSRSTRCLRGHPLISTLWGHVLCHRISACSTGSDPMYSSICQNNQMRSPLHLFMKVCIPPLEGVYRGRSPHSCGRRRS